MLKQFLSNIIKEVSQEVVDNLKYFISSELEDFSFKTSMKNIKESDLTQEEKDYLKKQGKVGELDLILDKLIVACSVASLHSKNELEIAEIRGMVKGFQHLKNQMLEEKKEEFDKVTGQKIK